MSEPVPVAVVGCGKFGQVHARAYAGFEGSRLAAVCDRDAARALALAERFGCRSCTDVAEVAADPDIIAVSVATPDFAHRAVCEALAAAGKHLLVEKPLATTVEDARAIAAAVEAAGVIGMIDFHNRYHPALRAIRDGLDAGRLGTPQMLFARLSDRLEVATHWFPWAARSGPEWFLGSHMADVACWLFGAAPTRVFAEGRKDVLAARGIDCYDGLQIHLSFPTGPATLETSWILPDTWPIVCDFSVSLQTTETRADVDMNHQGVTICSPAGYERPMLFGQTLVGRDEFGFFSLPIRDFVRAVAAGDRHVPMPLAEGVRNVEIIAAAVASAQSGEVVPLM